MEENVTLLAAFGAGLLSFVSPCVLPLVPGYLSYVSGLSLDELRGTSGAAAQPPAGARRRVIVASLAFILGFSLVFVALGATMTLFLPDLGYSGTGCAAILHRLAPEDGPDPPPATGTV